MGTESMLTPSSAAAICGAAGSFSIYGVVRLRSMVTLPAAIRLSASSLCSAPSRSSAPAATGFMPQARTPRLTSACSSADDVRVLPISVSVPVTKQANVGGKTAAAAAGLGCTASSLAVIGSSRLMASPFKRIDCIDQLRHFLRRMAGRQGDAQAGRAQGDGRRADRAHPQSLLIQGGRDAHHLGVFTDDHGLDGGSRRQGLPALQL